MEMPHLSSALPGHTSKTSHPTRVGLNKGFPSTGALEIQVASLAPGVGIYGPAGLVSLTPSTTNTESQVLFRLSSSYPEANG